MAYIFLSDFSLIELILLIWYLYFFNWLVCILSFVLIVIYIVVNLVMDYINDIIFNELKFLAIPAFGILK